MIRTAIALVLLLSATSLAAARHYHHYYGGTPNDTSRSFEYYNDMGQGSGKPNAR